MRISNTCPEVQHLQKPGSELRDRVSSASVFVLEFVLFDLSVSIVECVSRVAAIACRLAGGVLLRSSGNRFHIKASLAFTHFRVFNRSLTVSSHTTRSDPTWVVFCYSD